MHLNKKINKKKLINIPKSVKFSEINWNMAIPNLSFTVSLLSLIYKNLDLDPHKISLEDFINHEKKGKIWKGLFVGNL
uniref:CSON008875 protein n=1 Tax=Culicoides sonorensis TaxID=179676 RepID=A0A336M371_CULSO